MNAALRLVPRIGVALSSLPGWLEKLLLVVLCWQVAGIFWTLFAPPSADVNLLLPRQHSAASPVSRDAFLRWYGGDDKAVAEVLGDYTLMAVIAGKNGVALLKNGDTSVALGVGSELRPGSKLVAVEPNQIIVEQGGVRKTIEFSRAASAGAPLFAKADPAARRALTPIKLTRGDLAKLIQGGNLGRWDQGLAALPEGGVRVENAASQPLAKLLQLRSGDILKKINHRPLDQLADISLVFHYFGQSAAVDLVLVRNGAPLTQHYEIQP